MPLLVEIGIALIAMSTAILCCRENQETSDGPWPVARYVAFSPDGNNLAVATSFIDDANDRIFGNVVIYDVTTAETKNSFLGFENWLMACAYSPDGKSLATGSYAEGVVLWDLETCEPKPGFGKNPGRVVSVCFSPDGATIAAGDLSGAVVLWDAKTGRKQLTIKHKDADFSGVGCVVFSPDGKTLASAGNGKLKLWNPTTGKELASLDAHSPYQINGVAFSDNGKLIASASLDRTIKLWDAAEFNELKSLRPTDMAYSAVFAADDTKLYSTDENGEIAIWDVASGDRLNTLKGHTNAVYHVSISPDGKFLASASHDKTARLWDIDSGKVIHVFRPEPPDSR